jgi:hypothetical protein
MSDDSRGLVMPPSLDEQHPPHPLSGLAPPEYPCPECGRPFTTKQGLGRHRLSAHGVKGKATRTLQRRQATASKASKGREHLRQLLSTPSVLEDDPLHADDVMFAVINMLYPHGVIPTKHVLSLLRWREATERMLNEVMDE